MALIFQCTYTNLRDIKFINFILFMQFIHFIKYYTYPYLQNHNHKNSQEIMYVYKTPNISLFCIKDRSHCMHSWKPRRKISSLLAADNIRGAHTRARCEAIAKTCHFSYPWANAIVFSEHNVNQTINTLRFKTNYREGTRVMRIIDRCHYRYILLWINI